MQKKLFMGLVMSLFCSLVVAQSNRAVKYFNKAREAVTLNEYKEAKEYLDKAIEDSPGYSDALLFAADLYRKEGNTDKALQYYETVLQNRGPYYTYLFYGQTLFAAGRYQEAIKALNAYQQSPQANPHMPERSSNSLTTPVLPYNPRPVRVPTTPRIWARM